MFKQIVVANDGSDGGFRALTMACDLGRTKQTMILNIGLSSMSGAKSIMKRYTCPSGA
jgi:hypothetical protein